MSNATISFGPKLGLLNNAAINETYYDPFRPFLRGVDALVQASVKDILTTPPASPNNGDAYIVRAVATGLWVGQETKIAVYSNQITLAGTDTLTTGWDFYTPQAGWWVYCVADGLYHRFNNSGAWVSALATSNVPGFVVPDGTTITINGSGVISSGQAGIATTSAVGLVKPDGVSITVNGTGLIAVPTATNSVFGLSKPDGTSITVSGGVISATPYTLPAATNSVLGGVKPDGTSITVNGSGVITATYSYTLPTATTSVLGGVKVDGTSISIAGGVISATNTGLLKGSGTQGYIPLFAGADSPPLSPPTTTDLVTTSHLDDGITIPGHITSSEPLVVQGTFTATILMPYILYSASGTPLPAAGPSYQGATAIVSDATAPSFMAPYVSGGTVTCAVICSYDGSASPPTYQWLIH